MKDTKSFILETSFKLFLQKSFKEVTMKEIVEETELSKGAFYHYFASKEELFKEIIDVFYMNFFSIDYTQFNQENLYAFYTEYFNYVEHGFQELLVSFGGDKTRNAVNFFLIIFDAFKLYPGFRELTIEMTEKELQSWTKVIKTAREKGEIRSTMTDEQIASIFTNTNDGISLHAIMMGRVDNLVQEIRSTFDAFYNEIKA